MNKVLQALILIIAICLMSTTADAVYVGQPLDHSLLPYHYKISSKMFNLNSNNYELTSQEIIFEIQHAFNTWATVTGTELSFIYGGFYEPNNNTDDHNEPGIIYLNLEFVDNSKGTIAGHADQRENNEGQVVSGNITVNTGIINVEKKGAIFKIVMHELGHVLGIHHSPIIGSIMNYNKDFYYWFLPLDDQDAIRQLYPDPNMEGGEVTVYASLNGDAAKGVTVALIDDITGIGRFSVTHGDGIAIFTRVPSSNYIIAVRQPIPVGVCDFYHGTKNFLPTFYNESGASNSPFDAESIPIDNDSHYISISLIEGVSKYDCYYGMKLYTEDVKHKHYTPFFSEYQTEPGKEFMLRIVKDWPEGYYEVVTSGDIKEGTEVMAAGDNPGYTIAKKGQVVGKDSENRYSIYALVNVDNNAELGPRVIYCENEGEFTFTSAGFYIVDQLVEDPLAHIHSPIKEMIAEKVPKESIPVDIQMHNIIAMLGSDPTIFRPVNIDLSNYDQYYEPEEPDEKPDIKKKINEDEVIKLSNSIVPDTESGKIHIQRATAGGCSLIGNGPINLNSMAIILILLLLTTVLFSQFVFLAIMRKR